MTTLDALPHWHQEPDVYDALFLAGQRIPGVVKVEVSRKVKIDKKSPKGKHKAVITKQGLEAAEITIEIRVLDPEDVAQLQGQMDLLEPVPDKEKATAEDALDIAHWVTTWRKIESIVIEETKGPELADGVLVLTIKAVEFDKTKPALAGGPGNGSGGGGLKFGFFYDQVGQPIPGTYVARVGPVALNDGQPIKDPEGNAMFVCQQLAIMTNGTLQEVAATFLGRYVSEDPLIKLKWQESHPPGGKPKDATSTPSTSKGSPSLTEFQSNDPPDPTSTDTGP